jgi:predicted transcriptional regulator
MTRKDIDFVFNLIAKKSENDETKPIGFVELLQGTGMEREKLEKILVYLSKEKLIKIRSAAFNDGDAVYLTHRGINKLLA